MARVTTRDRNKNKFYKDGRPKPPNWEYRFSIAPVNGKRQHSSQAGFKTQKEAIEAGTKSMAEYLNGGDVYKPKDISYRDFINIWYEQYVEINLRVSTQRKYLGNINKHFLPALGKYKLSAIKPITLQKFLNSYKEKGYSHQTINNLYAALKTSFAFAVEPLQYLKSNPMDHVKKPRADKKRTRERYILNKDEWQKILSKFTPESKYHIALMIGYHAGLRIGETLALTWDDIDFDNKTLTVNKQLLAYKPKNNKRLWVLAPPKTPASNRTILIGQTLLDALKKEKIKQAQNRLLYGEYFLQYAAKPIESGLKEIVLDFDKNNNLSFICIQDDGKYMNWDNMRYCFRFIQEQLKIKFEYHALRHTHATLLVASGANIKSVQKRLGHERVETTLQIYAHDSEEQNEKAVELFEMALK